MKKEIDCPYYKFGELEYYQFPDAEGFPQVFFKGINVTTGEQKQLNNLKFILEEKDQKNFTLQIGKRKVDFLVPENLDIRKTKRIFANKSHVLFITDDNVYLLNMFSRKPVLEKMRNQYAKQGILLLEKNEGIKNLLFLPSGKRDDELAVLIIHTEKNNLYGYGYQNIYGLFGAQNKVKMLENFEKLNKLPVKYLVSNLSSTSLNYENKYLPFVLSYEEDQVKFVTSGSFLFSKTIKPLKNTSRPTKLSKEKNNIVIIPQITKQMYMFTRFILSYNYKTNKFILFPGSRANKIEENDKLILPDYIEKNKYIFIDYIDLENYINC